jgi:GxxExxY protein
MTVPTPREELLAKLVVQSAFKVHSSLGPGLLESIYETCFCHELNKLGIPNRRQVEVPINYDGLELRPGLRIDVLVDDLIICELKSVRELNEVFVAQVMSQLKLANKHLGFLINFNVATIRRGIRRVII